MKVMSFKQVIGSHHPEDYENGYDVLQTKPPKALLIHLINSRGHHISRSATKTSDSLLRDFARK